MFAGQLLAYAGMDNGFHVTWIPSYGPEMRGGTANCTVIISDEPIGAPLVKQADIILAFNLPSFGKYEAVVKAGGLFVVNSSIIPTRSEREGIDVVYVPANDIAEGEGTTKMMNMAMVGAMLAQRPFLSLPALEQALRDHMPAGKAKLLDANIRVLQRGHAAAHNQVTA